MLFLSLDQSRSRGSEFRTGRSQRVARGFRFQSGDYSANNPVVSALAVV